LHGQIGERYLGGWLMIDRKDKSNKDSTFSEWEEWVKEAEKMYHLALQNPNFLRL
jgi:hypothetical protein